MQCLSMNGRPLLSNAGLTILENKKPQIDECHPLMTCIKAEERHFVVLSRIMWMKYKP